jgi:hypothetical protein
VQAIAIDWSGRARGAAETIWLARVVGGELVELDNGRERDEVVAHAVAHARDGERTVLGLDFAFGFPAWYAEREGWSTGRDAWQAMAERGDGLLAACEDPFWGRPGRPAQQLGAGLRATEQAVGGPAKSVFQIGGAGAVGTGSVRGMPHLATLAHAGFRVWPFDDPGWPLVVEIYPRLFAPGVVKSQGASRRGFLDERLTGQDPVLLERAASSEDAFDAAVSALALAAHAEELAALPAIDPASAVRLEGAIWRPAPMRECKI